MGSNYAEGFEGGATQSLAEKKTADTGSLKELFSFLRWYTLPVRTSNISPAYWLFATWKFIFCYGNAVLKRRPCYKTPGATFWSFNADTKPRKLLQISTGVHKTMVLKVLQNLSLPHQIPPRRKLMSEHHRWEASEDRLGILSLNTAAKGTCLDAKCPGKMSAGNVFCSGISFSTHPTEKGKKKIKKWNKSHKAKSLQASEVTSCLAPKRSPSEWDPLALFPRNGFSEITPTDQFSHNNGNWERMNGTILLTARGKHPVTRTNLPLSATAGIKVSSLQTVLGVKSP